ncbi:hypothetical protein VB636_05825 [Paracoccus sp. APAP_BH8]|uniref:hypothetical protein n=1 Tax=Paracoccus sp. APAP_BH8 TaxID=3110237 RepID=UPI002FD7FC7C
MPRPRPPAQKSHATAMDRLTRGPGNVISQAEMQRDLGARTQKRLALDHDGAESLEAPFEAAEYLIGYFGNGAAHG